MDNQELTMEIKPLEQKIEPVEQEINKAELKCIEIANTNPNACNKEGKEQLAMGVLEELPEKELTKFLRGYGYKHISNFDDDK